MESEWKRKAKKKAEQGKIVCEGFINNLPLPNSNKRMLFKDCMNDWMKLTPEERSKIQIFCKGEEGISDVNECLGKETLKSNVDPSLIVEESLECESEAQKAPNGGIKKEFRRWCYTGISHATTSELSLSAPKPKQRPHKSTYFSKEKKSKIIPSKEGEIGEKITKRPKKRKKKTIIDKHTDVSTIKLGDLSLPKSVFVKMRDAVLQVEYRQYYVMEDPTPYGITQERIEQMTIEEIAFLPRQLDLEDWHYRALPIEKGFLIGKDLSGNLCTSKIIKGTPLSINIKSVSEVFKTNQIKFLSLFHTHPDRALIPSKNDMHGASRDNLQFIVVGGFQRKKPIVELYFLNSSASWMDLATSGLWLVDALTKPEPKERLFTILDLGGMTSNRAEGLLPTFTGYLDWKGAAEYILKFKSLFGPYLNCFTIDLSDFKIIPQPKRYFPQVVIDAMVAIMGYNVERLHPEAQREERRLISRFRPSEPLEIYNYFRTRFSSFFSGFYLPEDIAEYIPKSHDRIWEWVRKDREFFEKEKKGEFQTPSQISPPIISNFMGKGVGTLIKVDLDSFELPHSLQRSWDSDQLIKRSIQSVSVRDFESLIDVGVEFQTSSEGESAKVQGGFEVQLFLGDFDKTKFKNIENNSKGMGFEKYTKEEVEELITILYRPRGGLWSSTYNPKIGSQEARFWGVDSGEIASILTVEGHPKLYIIDSVDDVKKLIDRFPSRKPLIDFEAVSEFYDGIHLTAKGVHEAFIISEDYFFYGWEVECTLWFNLKHLSLSRKMKVRSGWVRESEWLREFRMSTFETSKKSKDDEEPLLGDLIRRDFEKGVLSPEEIAKKYDLSISTINKMKRYWETQLREETVSGSLSQREQIFELLDRGVLNNKKIARITKASPHLISRAKRVWRQAKDRGVPVKMLGLSIPPPIKEIKPEDLERRIPFIEIRGKKYPLTLLAEIEFQVLRALYNPNTEYQLYTASRRGDILIPIMKEISRRITIYAALNRLFKKNLVYLKDAVYRDKKPIRYYLTEYGKGVLEKMLRLSSSKYETPRKKIPEKKIRTIKVLWKKNIYSVGDISRISGIPLHTVATVIKREGLRRPPTIGDQIAMLFEEGVLSDKQIANLFPSISKHNIQKMRKTWLEASQSQKTATERSISRDRERLLTEIVSLHEEGCSPKEIIQKTGVSARYLGRILKDLSNFGEISETKFRAPDTDEEEISDVIELLKDGYPTERIAERVGVSEKFIQEILTKIRKGEFEGISVNDINPKYYGVDPTEAWRSKENLVEVKVKVFKDFIDLRWSRKKKPIGYAVRAAVDKVPELSKMKIFAGFGRIRFAPEEREKIVSALIRVGFDTPSKVQRYEG